MNKKRCYMTVVILTLVLSLLFPHGVKAEELAFYSISLEEEFRHCPEVFESLKKEVVNQSRAVAEKNHVSIEEDIDSLDMSTAIKVAIIRTDSEKTLEYDNTTDGIIEQIKSAKDVVEERSHISSATYDPLQSKYLDYCWFVMVASDGSEMLYATVHLKYLKNYQVEYSVSCTYESLINSNRYWLSNQEDVKRALRTCKDAVDYDTVLPLTLPELEMDVILFSANHNVYAVPFSRKIETDGIKNGESISFDDLAESVQKRAESVTGVKATTAFEKMLSNGAIYGIISVFCIGCVALVFYTRRRKKANGKNMGVKD